MTYTTADDFWTIAGVAMAFGAAGGLAWDIINPIRPKPNSFATGMENRVSMPRVLKDHRTRTLDLGVLGPIFIGAVTGLVSALVALQLGGPDATDVAQGVLEVQRSGLGAAAQQINTSFAPSIDLPVLALFSLSGGVAGYGLLVALVTRTTEVFNAAVKFGEQTEANRQAAGEANEDGRAKASGDTREQSLGQPV